MAHATETSGQGRVGSSGHSWGSASEAALALVVGLTLVARAMLMLHVHLDCLGPNLRKQMFGVASLGPTSS